MTGMTTIFRNRLRHLARGEEGVALVVTMAVFMMLYVSCAAVFTIGQSVKERVILQNAADAAAYSAAVVQADTLSRIAVLNREMAWRYKCMVGRQMDYIACKWIAYNCDEDHTGNYKFYKDKTAVRAHRGKTPNWISLRERLDIDSSYGSEAAERAESLSDEIAADEAAINALGDEIDALLSDYGSAASQVAKDILEANLKGVCADKCYYSITFRPLDGLCRELSGGEEAWFLHHVSDSFGFSDYGAASLEEFFPVMSELTHNPQGNSYFRTAWDWLDGLDWVPVSRYDYRHEDELSGDHTVHTEAARPRVLKTEYFTEGEEEERVAGGAITVGIARENENPWARFADVTGLYSVFTPSSSAKWSWAVASAQAGFRPFRPAGGAPADSDSDETRFDYILDVTDADSEPENLRTDNWNALFVPVRRAFTRETFAKWICNENDDWEILDDEVATGTTGALAEYSPSTISTTLPSMHNSGTTSGSLDWGEMRDMFYH